MLKEFFVPYLKRLGKVSSAILQQNGASPHFSRDIRQYFFSYLVDRKRWCPLDEHHVPLTCLPLNFFLWRYVTNNIYKSPIRDLDELKIKIADKIENISSVRCFL